MALRWQDSIDPVTEFAKWYKDTHQDEGQRLVGQGGEEYLPKNDKLQLYGQWSESEAKDFARSLGYDPANLVFNKGVRDSYFTMKSGAGAGGEEGGGMGGESSKQGMSLADQLKTVADLTMQYLPQFQGLLYGQSQEYLPKYLSLYNQLRETDLGNILNTATGMQPRLDALQRQTEGANLSEMRDLASQQVLDELRSGQSLSPAMTRNVEQGVRAGEVARGIGSGGGSANREAVRKSLEGYNLWKDRLGLSQNLRSFEQGMRYDPIAFTAGTPTNVPYAKGSFDQGVNLTGTTMGSAMQMKSLQDQLAQSGSQFNAQMDLQNRMYEAQQQYLPMLQSIMQG